MHDELQRAVLARDRFMCGACYASPSAGDDGECLLQVDHLVPVAGGGDNESTNLRTLARDRFMCGACYASPSAGDDGECLLQVDHLVPVAGGGDNESTNLRTLCARCNEEKSNRFTADVRAARPRLIVAYCWEDVEADADEGEDDLGSAARVGDI